MQNNIKLKALTYFNKGSIDKAKNLYEKARKKNPNDPECLYMLGAIYGQKKNYTQAIRYFNKTLELQPGAFIALCGLGNAQKEVGLYHDAESTYRKALELQPNNQDLMLELAGVSLHLGNDENAEKLLTDILSRNPNNTEALHGLGEIFQSRREFEIAINYYTSALGTEPNRAGTHHRLGVTLHCLGNYNEAIEHLEAAISQDIYFQDAYTNLAISLIAAGKIKRAQDTLNSALKLWPDSINILVSKASLLEKEGKSTKAYELIEPLLHKDIHHPALGIVFLDICHELDKCQHAIEYMENLISIPNTPDKTRESMHYAIGNVYDKIGLYDKAFHHYYDANKTRPNSYNNTEHKLLIDSIIKVFGYKYFTNNIISRIDKTLPTFIVGMPRSGTSLIEQILQSHSSVTGAGELNDVGMIAHSIQGNTDIPKDYPFNCEFLTTDILDNFSTKYYKKLETISPTSLYVTDKMPHNFLYLGLISSLFPNAKVIHCRRNPMDTCLSIYFQNFHEKHNYANNLSDLGHYYIEYTRLMDHWTKCLNINIYEVSYDEIVRNPEEEIRQLLEYMNLEWEENCLMFHQSDRYIATASHKQVREPIYTKSLERWKHYEDYMGPLIEALKPLNTN